MTLRRLPALVAAVLLLLLPAGSGAAELTLHVFDVGQGDGMLVVSPAGKTVLIDAGPPEATEKLVKRLHELTPGPIDLVLMTHPHADHIGGMEAAVRELGAKIFMEPGFDHPSAMYASLLRTLESKKVALRVGKAGNNVELGGGAVMHLLAPKDPFFKHTRSDANANSIVVRLSYGKTAFYLAADSEAETEHRIVESGEELACDVYKVAHHASRHSNTSELLQKIHPKIAVVSVGARNDYGHPTREALDRLEAVHAEVLRTDLDGEIIIRSDGERVTYSTEKGGGLTAVEDKPEPPAIAVAPVTEPTPAPLHDPPKKKHEPKHKPEKPAPVEKPEAQAEAKPDAGVKVSTATVVAPEATPAPSPNGYAASKNAQVFHRPECANVARIKPENLMHFSERDEALATGRRAAKDCNP